MDLNCLKRPRRLVVGSRFVIFANLSSRSIPNQSAHLELPLDCFAGKLRWSLFGGGSARHPSSIPELQNSSVSLLPGHRDYSASILRGTPALTRMMRLSFGSNWNLRQNFLNRAPVNDVVELEQKHGARREWVWARMGSSPWAFALLPLTRLSKLSQSVLGGATIGSVASAYADGGWRCDWAAMEALAHFRNTADAGVVARIVSTIYEPWLDASSRHFQDLLYKQPAEARKAVGSVKGEKDTCILFVDGLRFDLCGRLAEVLESRSLSTKLRHRLAHPCPR